MSEKTKSKKPQTQKLNLLDPKLIIVAIVVLIAGLFFIFRSEFIVATVNGQPITRMELVKTLEEQAGQQALEGLVVQELIRQEAANKGIEVNQEDVDKEIENLETELEAQGQELDAFLELQGLTRDDIREQAELQILLEKLTADSSLLSEDDIEEAFTNALEQQQELLEDGDEEIDEEALRLEVEQGLTAQKQNQAIQEWIENAREQADINFLKQF